MKSTNKSINELAMDVDFETLSFLLLRALKNGRCSFIAPCVPLAQYSVTGTFSILYLSHACEMASPSPNQHHGSSQNC